MKDYTWLAVFSVFTLVVGALFTYGNATRADTKSQPIQVFVTSTSTPASSVIIRDSGTEASFPAPNITVNVMIATSSLMAHKPETETGKTSRTYHVTNNTTYVNQETEPEPVVEESHTVSLTIQGVYDAVSTPIEDGETVLQLLKRLDGTDPNLQLATQDYGDMGTLVTEMGGLINGTDDKYWQYEVDGVVPMIGADQYKLKDGQTIRWQFKGF